MHLTSISRLLSRPVRRQEGLVDFSSHAHHGAGDTLRLQAVRGEIDSFQGCGVPTGVTVPTAHPESARDLSHLHDQRGLRDVLGQHLQILERFRDLRVNECKSAGDEQGDDGDRDRDALPNSTDHGDLQAGATTLSPRDLGEPLPDKRG
jgi:hypothetical protein